VTNLSMPPCYSDGIPDHEFPHIHELKTTPLILQCCCGAKIEVTGDWMGFIRQHAGCGASPATKEARIKV